MKPVVIPIAVAPAPSAPIQATPLSSDPDSQRIALCNSQNLADGAIAVAFDVVHAGLTSRAFAIRYQGAVHAYLNRCTHVAMEMDWQPNQFFDDTGQWLLCSTHGAAYAPGTGECGGGPCHGGLVKITLTEEAGVVYWHTAYNLKAPAF